MAASAPVTAPKIPFLLGQENYTEWRRGMEDVLRYFDFHHVVFRDAPISPGTSRDLDKEAGDAMFVLGLVSASVAPVSPVLSGAGWDFTDTSLHPRCLFNLAERVFMPQIAERRERISKCLRELNTKPVDMPLRVFKERIESAKRTLAEDRVYPSDSITVFAVLGALKNQYEHWHRLLQIANKAGRLSWEQLLQRIEVKAMEEEADDKRRTGRS